jgi:DNA-binding FadR family transcriptional regulator
MTQNPVKTILMQPKARPSSEFIKYLASWEEHQEKDEHGHLPSLHDLSKELGISVAALREQLEVARALGFVEVKPRTGIRRQAYSFFPAASQSLMYAIQLDRRYFEAFSDLRNQIEAAFWFQAVQMLMPEDHHLLVSYVNKAWNLLNGSPVQIPHAEHRKLHLTIFCRLANPFVTGLLEAYWDAYEATGLNMFTEYAYLQQVWTYHQVMVDSICQGNYDAGYAALLEHKDLLQHRPITNASTPGSNQDDRSITKGEK